MKTIETNCQVCRRSIKIEVDEEWGDSPLLQMATCEICIDDHDRKERDRIAKYYKAIEREVGKYRKPYAD